MKKISMFLALAVAAIACEPKEEPIAASIDVVTPESELVIPFTGSEDEPLEIAFTSSLAWTAELVIDGLQAGDEPWCVIRPKSGEAGEAVISVLASPYDGADNRTAKVVITAGELTKDVVFTQLQKNSLAVAKTAYNVPAEGQTIALAVSTNADVTVSVPEEYASWIKYTPTKGITDKELSIVIEPNRAYNAETEAGFIAREGKFTVAVADAEPVEITVTQAAYERVFNVTFSDTVIPKAGGSITMTVESGLEYTVSINPDVFTLTNEGDVYTITANAYDGGEARFADVMFDFGDYAKFNTFYNVFQAGVNYNLWEVDMTTVMNRPAKAPMFSNDEQLTGVSIALYDGNLVVCAGDGSAPVILNKATGAKMGTIATGNFKPYTVAHDDAGNLVMSNRVWAKWNAIGNSFAIGYLAPNSSDFVTLIDTGVDDPDGSLREEYLGLSMDVKGDVTSNALIALPHNNGEYVNNVISLFSVENGVTTKNNLTLDGNYKGVGWAGAYFGAALHNHPGFALVGPSVAYGAVSCCYDANLLQSVDLTNGACAVLSDALIPNAWSAWSNAPTGVEIRTIGDNTFLVVVTSSFTSAAPVVMVFDAVTKELVATTASLPPFTVFQPTDAASTNYEYAHAAVTMEAAEDGMIVYLIDKSTSTIAARHFKL